MQDQIEEEAEDFVTKINESVETIRSLKRLASDFGYSDTDDLIRSRPLGDGRVVSELTIVGVCVHVCHHARTTSLPAVRIKENRPLAPVRRVDYNTLANGALARTIREIVATFGKADCEVTASVAS